MRVFTGIAILGFLASLNACGGGGGGGTSTPTSVATPPPTPAPTPTPAPAVNVTGTWLSQARSWDILLEQRGTTLTGVLLGFKNVTYDPSDPAVQITGTISASGKVNFKCLAWAYEFDGRAESSSRMTGTTYDCANGCRSYGEILVRQ